MSNIDKMVGRFLGWKLPDDFGPDAGTTFNPGHITPSSPHWPTGTNLLTAAQARQMFEHVTADKPAEGLQPHQQRVITVIGTPGLIALTLNRPGSTRIAF